MGTHTYVFVCHACVWEVSVISDVNSSHQLYYALDAVTFFFSVHDGLNFSPRLPYSQRGLLNHNPIKCDQR